MKKALLVLFLILIAGGAGYHFFLSGKDAKAQDAAAEATATVTVKRGPISSMVPTQGKVQANLEVEIKCKASGQIIKLPYDVSDVVTTGVLVVELDPIDEARNVKKAEIELKNSRAQLAKAKQDLVVAQKQLETDHKKCDATLVSAEARAKDARAKAERALRLFKDGAIGQEERETAETTAIGSEADLANAKVQKEQLAVQELSLENRRQEVLAAEAAVEGDQVNLDMAQQRLQDTRVKSPISGVVSSRNVNIGQIIASGINNVGGGTTMMTLADVSRMFILAQVDESDIGRVTVGQKAVITADAYPEEKFEGEVVRIGTKGTEASNVVYFDVNIEVTSENKALLKQAMTASINVVVAEKEDALIVPAEAVTGKGRQQFATVVKNGAQDTRKIETGITDGVSIEVVKGLEEGDTVLARKAGADSRWSKGPGSSYTPSVRAMMPGGMGKR